MLASHLQSLELKNAVLPRLKRRIIDIGLLLSSVCKYLNWSPAAIALGLSASKHGCFPKRMSVFYIQALPHLEIMRVTYFYQSQSHVEICHHQRKPGSTQLQLTVLYPQPNRNMYQLLATIRKASSSPALTSESNHPTPVSLISPSSRPKYQLRQPQSSHRTSSKPPL